jgi:hypothetical protein
MSLSSDGQAVPRCGVGLFRAIAWLASTIFGHYSNVEEKLAFITSVPPGLRIRTRRAHSRISPFPYPLALDVVGDSKSDARFRPKFHEHDLAQFLRDGSAAWSGTIPSASGTHSIIDWAGQEA